MDPTTAPSKKPADAIRRILVALDASPRAPMVLDAAVAFAARSDAKLILFRGVGVPPEVPPAALTLSPDNLASLLGEAAKRDLELLAKSVPEGLLESVDVGIGSPWQSICAAAQEKDVDLIVLGSHGYGGLDRLLGTTASKVVNHAERSVFVVRPRR